MEVKSYESVPECCGQHQQILVDVSRRLRQFFTLFPSTSPERTRALCPELSANRHWSYQEVYMMRDSLVTALGCVNDMFNAVEDRWQTSHTELASQLATAEAEHEADAEVARRKIERLESELWQRQAHHDAELTMAVQDCERVYLSRSQEMQRLEREREQKLREEWEEEREREREQDEVQRAREEERQESLESSIATLSGEIENMKQVQQSELHAQQDRDKDLQLHESRGRLQRLVESNRVLVAELETKRTSHNDIVQELSVRSTQSEMLLAEVKRLRERAASTPTGARWSALSDYT